MTMFDTRSKIFHELMPIKIREVLLISTPYEAWMMEADCRLSESIVHEYKGLNLSHPPRLTWVSTVDEATNILDHRRIDLLIIMLTKADRAAFSIREEIRRNYPDLMVALLTHEQPSEREKIEKWRIGDRKDAIFVWSGNTDILLAMIKGAEDFVNLDHDTRLAGIRIIILVEDSPRYLSAILPSLYKLLLVQTQRVMQEGLNEEHRLLAMRARPKIVFFESYEEAWNFYQKYQSYVLCVISDARIPRKGILAARGGIDLLKRVKDDRFDIPCLLYSAESVNAEKARAIDVAFVDKNAPSLFARVGSFFKDHLGFDDFIFKDAQGHEITRASTLKGLETKLRDIPDAVFRRHCRRNDFSRWLFVRSEIDLATTVRDISCDDFSCDSEHRQALIAILKESRMRRQESVIVNLGLNRFDTDTRFSKIGNGSLGGKARGLAFMAAQIPRYRSQLDAFKNARIVIPQTLVITTDIFDEFVDGNNLKQVAREEQSDAVIAGLFTQAAFPEETTDLLRTYLSVIRYPLAVRSSSLFEDSRSRDYAGLYQTVMLPNDQPDLDCRLDTLIRAIKLVYASTYFKGPKAFSKRVGNLVEEEKMAVIVQELMGVQQDRFFYPAISGMAQSHNFYPYTGTHTRDGIAIIALGLGKTVMDGERALRFSPKHPRKIIQGNTIKDVLGNAQRYFYALELKKTCVLDIADGANLTKREVANAEKEPVVRALLSTYCPDEDRIRDSFAGNGYGVLTFSTVLKYRRFPLADILDLFLKMGQEALRCPVEIEFCVDQLETKGTVPVFSILQIRPMSSRAQAGDITISDAETKRAVCVSTQALGNTIDSSMADIVYVDPDAFDPASTVEIAAEIRKINARLQKEGKKYLLIGPGRWGSADRWLGIPVKWPDICGVGGIIETAHAKLHAEPSQGSHFFHNIVSLGIAYLTVSDKEKDRLDVNWLTAQKKITQARYVVHSRLGQPITLIVSGQESFGVLLPPDRKRSTRVS